MFEIGDSLIYSGSGICKLTGIETKDIGHEARTCYVLNPVFDKNSTVYVPIESSTLGAKMRRLLSAEEIYTLIDEIPSEDSVWVEDENQRKELYKQIIVGSDRMALVQMIKAVLTHQQNLKSLGRRLHACDERFMKDAEKVLYEEFAYVLGMDRDDILPWLNTRKEDIVQEV